MTRIFVGAIDDRPPFGAGRALGVSVACLLVAAACVGDPLPNRRSLILHEDYRMAAPIGTQVSGAALAASGDVLVWSAPSRTAVVLRRHADQVVFAPRRLFIPLGGAFLPGDSTVEVFDASAVAVLRFRLDGALLSETKLRLAGTPMTVARTGDGWIVGSVDAAKRLRVERLFSGDSVPFCNLRL